MRVICRRERPHPGAQLSLFDTHAGWRHTCFITNTDSQTSPPWSCATAATPGSRTGCGAGRHAHWPTCPSTATRQRSLGGGVIDRRVTVGLEPDDRFEGALAKAEPKTMRYRVLHVAAVLAHRGRDLIVHLDETWPWASDWPPPLDALRRLPITDGSRRPTPKRFRRA